MIDGARTEAAHDPQEYGRHLAEQFDEIYDGVFDTEGAVALLGELAAGGPVLELGVGTGRLAIPLAATGLAVHGLDTSPAMVEVLHAKAGGAAVATTIGDVRDVELGMRFAAVAIVFNTLFGLPDQDAQLQAVANAARHLRPGGCFVVEAFVPEGGRSTGPVLRPRRLADGLVGLVVADDDRARQVLTTTQVVLGGAAGVRVYPLVHRYAHPTELDLMARLAGLALESRWADWRRTPFTRDSEGHVSVYRAPGAA